MRRVALLFLCVMAGTQLSAQSRYKEPWKDPTLPIIIDAYAENPIDFDQLVTDKRVCAIIHKASQGLSADRAYFQRKTLANQKSLLWGSYHMGMAGDPIAQADFYLNITQLDDCELMALDLEGLDTSTFMSLHNAERFIRRIYERTGRYPFIYCNNNVLEEISKKYDDSGVFSKCGLWYARFVKELPKFNNNLWKNYSFWQFSCEINCKETGNCCYNVPGVLYDMDINVWNGQTPYLKLNWPEVAIKWDPVEEAQFFRSNWDLDGDYINDSIFFDYSGGAHCCYKINIILSTDKKEYSFPFEMDGGYLFGPDDSQPDNFYIGDLDAEDGLPEIGMKIQSYNGKLSPVPRDWQKTYGFKTNRIIIDYDWRQKTLKVRDWNGEI